MGIFSPLESFARWFTGVVFDVAEGSQLAEATTFFIYDALKIFILLSVIIFAVSTIRSFLPAERIRDVLSRRGKYTGNVMASILGIITPFCSCSAIPLFLGFMQAGVPLGVTFSFLVASPMINEVALALLFGLFGWKIAGGYVVSGLAIAILAGVIIGRLKVEGLVEPFVIQDSTHGVAAVPSPSWGERFAYARAYTAGILKKIWPYVLVGIGIGAWIHGYVPADFLARYAGADRWYAVPLATLVGIPLYSNAAGVIPLVSALTEKGVAMGTTLAFMMAVTALSLPEFVILRRIMKPKLIALFAAIVGVGIIFTGYLFNWLLG